MSEKMESKMDIQEIKKEFGDCDFMRAVFNTYTVDTILWMISRIAEQDKEIKRLKNHGGRCHSCTHENEMECGAEQEDVEYADCKIVMKCKLYEALKEIAGCH
jgi:hypothetical protein